MKLGTIKNGTRDGKLVVVSRDHATYVVAGDIAPTMQAALDTWAESEPKLRALSDKLNAGDVTGEAVDWNAFHSPLPRAYEWIDGSAYLNHVILVRKARNAEPPKTLTTDPLVYQGGSGHFLAPREDIVLHDVENGLDFEAEICAILGDTPIAQKEATAGEHIKLFTLCNDNTLRKRIPAELAKGFGFFVGKPATTFAPLAITPDELGDAYKDGRVHLTMHTEYNGEVVGDVKAGPEMHFSFPRLIEHVTQTRQLTAGTILGSGTISNEDRSAGISCLAERRMIETIDEGAPKTPFMNVGDTIEISMKNEAGDDLFGVISQKVVAPS